MAPLSVLDLSPIIQGSHAGQALCNSLDLARRTEKLGYNRYWVAEHHNMAGIASAATAVVIGHIASGTQTIRVGSGGIMLPNHAPLVIAEQFGTLESLYPGRIDLGLGRAPGTDQFTAYALRRNLAGDVDQFPRDVQELQNYFGSNQPGQRVTAVPGNGLEIPIWILGSSLYGAQLAAALGLPYAFASHFAPAAMMQAIEIYRQRFEPSAQLAEPYVMLGCNVCAAQTDDEAWLLRSSALQSTLNLRRGQPGPLPPPVANLESRINSHEKIMLDELQTASMVGSPETVHQELEAFMALTTPDELIISAQIYDHSARCRSYEITADIAIPKSPSFPL
jgi:luciferase family oxidoreductase group 1